MNHAVSRGQRCSRCGPPAHTRCHPECQQVSCPPLMLVVFMGCSLRCIRGKHGPCRRRHPRRALVRPLPILICFGFPSLCPYPPALPPPCLFPPGVSNTEGGGEDEGGRGGAARAASGGIQGMHMCLTDARTSFVFEDQSSRPKISARGDEAEARLRPSS